jgi:hypothetical protein
MTVLDIIKASLRKVGGMSVGETLDSDRQSAALQALQSMLRSWSQMQILVHASTEESITLIAAKTSYTWGSGGDINSDRPHQIYEAFVRDSGDTDYPVTIYTEGEFQRITSKSISGRPTVAYYKPSYPLGTLFLNPVADAIETLHVFCYKPFTETSSFGTVADTLALPVGYEEPVIYNLAIRLAPEVGRSVSAEVALIARSSYNMLVNLNASRIIESVRLHSELPAGSHSAYNINEG